MDSMGLVIGAAVVVLLGIFAAVAVTASPSRRQRAQRIRRGAKKHEARQRSSAPNRDERVTSGLPASQAFGSRLSSSAPSTARETARGVAASDDEMASEVVRLLLETKLPDAIRAGEARRKLEAMLTPSQLQALEAEFHKAMGLK